jgi:hypothetical protein
MAFFLAFSLGWLGEPDLVVAMSIAEGVAVR